MIHLPSGKIKADLHIHTCLSPCGDWSMTPLKIISKVKCEKINLIAVCDHNTSKNVPPLIRLGEKQGIKVLCGMEICTKEEIHLIALFRSFETACKMEKTVHAALAGKNTPEIFGHQIIADENDIVVGMEDKLLIGACDITLNSALDEIHSLGGLAVAAHIDRPAFSIISQLGFIPPDVELDAVEISCQYCDKRVDSIDFPCVCSSDAHFIKDIGTAYTLFEMEEASFEAVKSALKQRKIRPCQKDQ